MSPKQNSALLRSGGLAAICDHEDASIMMKAQMPMLAEQKARAWDFEGILEQLNQCLQGSNFIFFITREKYLLLFKPLLFLADK